MRKVLGRPTTASTPAMLVSPMTILLYPPAPRPVPTSTGTVPVPFLCTALLHVGAGARPVLISAVPSRGGEGEGEAVPS